jgi:hypothetical protein
MVDTGMILPAGVFLKLNPAVSPGVEIRRIVSQSSFPVLKTSRFWL